MFRTRYILLALVLIVAASSVAKAESAKDKVSLAYDLDFEMRFDNREFYRSRFSESMTIFGARLTPSVGVQIVQDNGLRHRLMAGIDVMKDFGDSAANRELFRELTIYYNVQKQVGDNGLELYAGIFPRKLLDGRWTQAFFSDSLRFYDDNLEGILLKFHRPKAYFEVGCDWMGQYGATRREKFMIFTAGEGKVLPFMSLGYAGYMLHYANSGIAKGLVDNLLVNPYARFDLGYLTDMQSLSFRVGWLQAMQRDREYDGVFIFPYGVEFDQEIRKWNVGILNKVFYGMDMMPYYNNIDNAGLKYGSDLYFGDPFYRVHDDGSKGAGVYDRFELYYEPKIGDFLKLRVSALFHFHNHGYSGCQQMVSLCFNLESLISSRKLK